MRQSLGRRHEIAPMAFAAGTRMHQQFLNFSTMHAIGFGAQRNLDCADDDTVFGTHQHMFFAVCDFTFHATPVSVQLSITNGQHEPYRCPVLYRIAQ